MKLSKEKYLIALSTFVPFGPQRLKLLIKYFGTPGKVWLAKKDELLETGLSQKIVNDFVKHREVFLVEKYFNKLKHLGITCLTKTDKGYPKILKEIDTAPFVLYVKGKILKADENAIAIVGSRKMSYYGREVAEKFASELGSLGVTVVSGLARGVDTWAHRGSLEGGGRTLAVLGCGLDKIYPPDNKKLSEKIVENGALLSEYPLGYPALPHNFAARNRIISGLSKAVVVVEGRKKSGTLLTVGHALDQGKTVFAVPGQITSPLSEAPHFLLQNGAKPAFSVKDILEELNLQLLVDSETVEKNFPDDEDEEKICKSLEVEGLHVDEVVRITRLPIDLVSAKLVVLEIKGIVKNIGNGKYRKV